MSAHRSVSKSRRCVCLSYLRLASVKIGFRFNKTGLLFAEIVSVGQKEAKGDGRGRRGWSDLAGTAKIEAEIGGWMKVFWNQ